MATHSIRISNKSLGIALFTALIIQFVLPNIGFNQLNWVSTLIYLLIAIYLVFLV